MEENLTEQQTNESTNNTKKQSVCNDVVNWKAVIIFLIGIIGLSFLYSFILLAAFMSVENYDLFNALANKTEFNKINGAMQFLTYVFGFCIAYKIIGERAIKKIFSKYKEFTVYTRGVVYGFILLAAQSVYSIVITIITGPVDANQNQNALIELAKASPLFMGITTVILAPFFEEITYRYSLFGVVHKKSRILAYAITILVFGLIHFDFGCFESVEKMKVELLNLPAYLISGGILCYAYEKEDSLICSITAHATNNFIAFAQILFL